MQLLGMLPQMPWGNAGLWGLDDLEDPETAAVVQQAIDDPDRFVLKPQREGGRQQPVWRGCPTEATDQEGPFSLHSHAEDTSTHQQVLAWATCHALQCIAACCCYSCCMHCCRLMVQLPVNACC